MERESIIFKAMGNNPGIKKEDLQSGIPAADPKLREKELIIEQLKKEKAAVERSEEEYRRLAELSQDLIFIIDPSYRIRYANAKAARYLDTDQYEIAGKNFDELFREDCCAELRKGIGKVFETGKSVSAEERVEFPGFRVWLDSRIIPIKREEIRGNKNRDFAEMWVTPAKKKASPDDLKVTEVMIISRDITKSREEKEEIVRLHAFNETLLKTVPFGMDIIDGDCNVLYMDDKVQALLAAAGRKFNEGASCFTLYKDNRKQCALCPLKRGITEGETSSVEVENVFGGKSFRVFHTGMVYQGKKAILEVFVDITELAAARRKQEALNGALADSNRKLESMTLQDSNTGLYNTRYFQKIIKEEFTRSQREDEPLALVMLDLDNFKSVNDVYGHPFGDLVIKQFAQRLKKLFRPYDSVVRYGGEEFIILAPKTDRASALRLAGRIFRDTESRYFGNPNNLVRVNVSAAVVSYPENPVEKGEELVAAADHVLRKVKEDGGNRVYSSLDLRTRYNGISSKKGSVYELKNKLEKLTRRRTQTLLETIFAFARTIKQKDQYTGEHADRTVYYAGLLAKELKLAPAQVETIRQAAQLHDLGKIGVSEKILKKRGKLTAREFAEVKKHPQIGADILRPIQSLKEVVPMVLYHHERWDGKGYPYGLKGEAIPLGARIIALSDAFQALTFGRPYRRAYSLEKSIDIIAKEAGTKFDPEIVKAFTAVVTHNHGKSVLIPGKKRARRKV